MQTETHFGFEINLLDDEKLYKFLIWGEKLLSKTFTSPLIGLVLNIACLFPKTGEPINRVAETCISRTMETFKKQNFHEESDDLGYPRTVIHENRLLKKSMKNVRGEFIEFISVGSHTVSALVGTALLFLSVHPDKQEEAWLEQKEIFDNSDRDPTVHDVARMEYLDRVCMETLRFITGPTLVRRAKADINIGGYIIPKQSSVLLISKMVRMDSRYLKDPNKFDPDRYLRDEPPQTFKQAFSVFGFGSRNCPGGQYGMNQGKIMLSSIIRGFKITSDLKYDDIKYRAGIIMEVKSGYMMSLVKRQP